MRWGIMADAALPVRLARHPVIGGGLLGLTWGMAIRLWMRFISTDPEFTWSGTGFILGASALVGAFLGLAWWRRSLGRGNWWRLAGLAILSLGMGAGVIMLPSVLLGGLALGRSRWNPRLRGTLLTVAGGIQIALLVATGEDLPKGRLLPALLAYLILIGLEAWALSIVFMPTRSDVPALGTREPLPTDAGG